MSGAAKVNFNVHNLTDTVVNAADGVDFIQGLSVRGPFGKPDEIFTNWPAFVRVYGGLHPELETPRLIKRILEKGGSVRFSRVTSYDETGKPTPKVATLIPTLELNITGLENANGTILKLDIKNTDTQVIVVTEQINLVDGELENLNKIITTIENTQLGTAYIADDDDSKNIIVRFYTGDLTLDISKASGDAEVIIHKQNKELPFGIGLKYGGTDGNNMVVTITQGSNGQPNSYNLQVTHISDPLVSETYTNITIPNEAYTQEGYVANYLKEIITNSIYINVEYFDLVGTVPIILDEPLILRFEGGTDSETIKAKDFIGTTELGNGLFAFDGYDDSYYLTSFDLDKLEEEEIELVLVAGSSYSKMRQDIIYCIYLTGETKVRLLTQRGALNIDNKFTMFVGAGLTTRDLDTGELITLNPLADILAGANRSDAQFGPWYSFAGPNRGIITDVLGVNVNFGTPAKQKDLDELANKGINMVINKSGSVKLWGNFSGQVAYNQERFINIVKLVIFIKKSLRPTLETFLEEPNDFSTWKRMYYVVKPFLDSLVTRRALYTYEWLGDQDAKSINDLVINTPTDVQNGKYKVRLNIKAINSIQEITVDIVLTPAGLDFELVSNLM